MGELLIDVLVDAFLDTIKIWPFLLLIYLLFEYLGQKRSDYLNGKRVGPVLGALSGCIPQCGASVAAATLYATRTITIGTLFAVFISTSDEAVPILMMYPNQWQTVGFLLLFKVIMATVIGITIDYVFKSFNKKRVHHKKVTEEFEHTCCDNHKKEHNNKNISSFGHALNRSFKIVLYIFIMTALLNLVIEFIGEEALETFLLTNSSLQPVVAALIGLIPNCVSSVLLTELYIEGIVSLGAVMAGLCTGAGVGLLVLFKSNRPMSQNFKILAGLYGIGVAIGMVVQFFVSI